MKTSYFTLFLIWGIVFFLFGFVQVNYNLSWFIFVDKIIIIFMTYFLLDNLIDKGASKRQ